MTMEKSLVTVSRKWHEPFVRVDVTDHGVGITMTGEDFLVALATELGVAPDTVLAAGEKVFSGMKRETAKVM